MTKLGQLDRINHVPDHPKKLLSTPANDSALMQEGMTPEYEGMLAFVGSVRLDTHLLGKRFPFYSEGYLNGSEVLPEKLLQPVFAHREV